MPERPPGTRGLSLSPFHESSKMFSIESPRADCVIARSDRLVFFILNPATMQIRCQMDLCGKTLVVSRGPSLGGYGS